MSLNALCLAVQGRLVDNGSQWWGSGWNDKIVQLLVGGRPIGCAGQLIIAIHGGSWTGETIEGLDEQFGVLITVSMRSSGVSYDRWMTELVCKRITGLWARMAAIRAQLHLDVGGDDVLNRANAIITQDAQALGLSAANGFIEPLQFRDGGQLMEKSGDWWNADGKERFAGVAQTMTFGLAGRVQPIEAPLT